MEVKIKDNNGYVDADWTIEDGIMVVSPKVEKFEPKDGDVVTYFNDDKPTVYIYKFGHKYNTSFYAAYSSMLEHCFVGEGEYLNMKKCDIRPATEEEKKLLFDKLKEKGFEWDAEKKEVVKIKWKPICGASYYKPGIRGAEINVVSDSWAEDVSDKSYYDKGWVFKTYEECDAFCNKLRLAIEGVKP